MMKKNYFHISFLFFFLVAISGVWMRLFPLSPSESLSYTNVLHGHSHLALLGWGFLGVFLLFLAIMWKHIKSKKQAMAICAALSVTSILMFIAFLWQGYDTVSIIMSAIHIFIEYWAAIFMYKQLKHLRSLPKSVSLLMNGAFITLIISSFGPYGIAFISANGLKGTPLYEMAIYFYLHFLYNGWFTLFLIALFSLFLYLKKIHFNQHKLTISFWIYFISLFPGYSISIGWVEAGAFVDILASIGGIGQWISIILLIFVFRDSWKVLKSELPKVISFGLWITFLLLVIKGTMELGMIAPNMATLVYDTRNVIIGYLHLTLLGFVSFAILVGFYMLDFIKVSKLSLAGIIVFLIGFIFNELLLFLDALLEWANLSRIPYTIEGLLIASIFLAVGVLFMWISTFNVYSTVDGSISEHNSLPIQK